MWWVEFDTNQTLPWLGSARATARCMRAGIVHERSNLCGVDDTYGGYAALVACFMLNMK